MQKINLLLGCIVALLTSAGCANDHSSSSQGALSMLKPIALRCEYRVNPMGIDQTSPRLDWQLLADQPEVRGQMQSGYRIVVASSEANLAKDQGDLWDTGKVKSDATTQIAYAGKALASEQRAFWKVRVWDGGGQESGWSAPAKFSMGLLQDSDWKAKWIGYDAPEDESAPASATQPAETLNFEGLSWMWLLDEQDNTHQPHPASQVVAAGGIPAGARYFRKVISVPATGKLVRAHGVITCDNRFELFVNGRPCGFGGDWRNTTSVEFTQLLHPGENVIAIWAKNDATGPAGLIGRFRVKMDNAPSNLIDIDNTWQVSQTEVAGWKTEVKLADATAWQKPIAVRKYGEEPWGKPSVRGLILPPPPYLRKDFKITKPIARATVYASALGIYELHINGQRVGTDELTPGWTEYAKRVHYNTYDVTSMLHGGDNAIGAMLGDGWYAGYFGFTGNRELYGKEPRVITQLNIEYADGSKDSVVTDNSWRAAYGPIREADMLMGCTYDANKELGSWDNVNYDASKWQPVAVTEKVPPILQAMPSNTVQALEEITAKKMSQPDQATYVFDLGQNMVGWIRMHLSLKPGQHIQLRYAEMLNPDGTLYTTALRSARATDTYTAGPDGDVIWEPKFTFHGFRYVEITGLDSPPAITSIVGIVVHTQMQRSGNFECSNPLVNKLVHNIIWGQKGNYLEVPTDCPQRDERLGWTGDAQFFIPTGSYNFDVSAFFTKWLVDLNEDSADANGAFGSVAPDALKGGYGATAWADAGIVCPYTIYKMYGDTRVIERHYASMAKYIGWLQSTSKDYVRGQGNYGDWLNLGGGAKSEVIGTAYSEHVTRLLAEMADAIGKKDDAAKYRELADKIKSAFVKNFVGNDGKILESSQTGYALAFAFNLIPDNLRAKAGDVFVDEIKKKDWHLATGFIGTPRLLPALSLAGHDDVAYRLLQQETFPGWLFQVKLGSTTMWERWDGWTPEKGFQDPGMNSFNHYAFGSVGEWMYRTAGGIDTDGPGFKKIIIRPEPGGDLKFAKATYDSIHGPISSEWKIDGDQITLIASIPVNTTATVYVPTSDAKSVKESGESAGKGVKLLRTENGAAVYEVGSGNYRFTAKK